MTTDAVVRARISGQVRDEATAVLASMGLSVSDAIRMMLVRVAAEKALPFKDHPLSGDWISYRDCHVEPDWLLIYKVDGEELILARTGTHADLFR